MFQRILVALLVLSFITGCGEENGPKPVTPSPSTMAATPGTETPQTMTASGTSPTGNQGNPEFKEDRKIYEQDTIKVLEVTVTTFDKPGASLKDVENDIDPRDDWEPTVDVLFQEGEFGKGAGQANAVMKQRGSSTRAAAQKSFKITLKDKDHPWRNHRVLNLNKHPYDLTRIRNKLSFDLFKTLPHIGSLRTQFIHLTLKSKAGEPGKDYGLFTLVENCKEEYLTDHGLDPKGYLYSPVSFFFQRYPESLKPSGDPTYKKEEFEKVLEIRGNDDRTKILSMLDDVNNEALDINLVIQKHFNLDNYLTWFAANILMENLDTYSQNFNLYSPTGSAGWYFIPWDYDGAWGFNSQPDQLAAANLHLRWHEGVSNWWDAVLHRRFLKVPENVKALQAKVEELSKNGLTTENIKTLIKDFHEQVQPFVCRPPDLDHLPMKPGEDGKKADAGARLAAFEAEINRLPSIVENSKTVFLSTLGRPMPFHLGEITAEKNQTVFHWENSFSLTGDQITYDFFISKTPEFEKKDLVFESLNLEEAKLESYSPAVAQLSLPKASLPMGTLYWKIIARAKMKPSDNWQTAFDYLDLDEKIYEGVRSFVKP